MSKANLFMEFDDVCNDENEFFGSPTCSQEYPRGLPPEDIIYDLNMITPIIEQKDTLLSDFGMINLKNTSKQIQQQDGQDFTKSSILLNNSHINFKDSNYKQDNVYSSQIEKQLKNSPNNLQLDNNTFINQEHNFKDDNLQNQQIRMIENNQTQTSPLPYFNQSQKKRIFSNFSCDMSPFPLFQQDIPFRSLKGSQLCEMIPLQIQPYNDQKISSKQNHHSDELNNQNINISFEEQNEDQQTIKLINPPKQTLKLMNTVRQQNEFQQIREQENNHSLINRKDDVKIDSLFNSLNKISQKQVNQKDLSFYNPQNSTNISLNEECKPNTQDKPPLPSPINQPNNMLGSFYPPYIPWFNGYSGFPLSFYPPLPNTGSQQLNSIQPQQNYQNLSRPCSFQAPLQSPILSISINKMNEIVLNLYNNRNNSHSYGLEKQNQNLPNKTQITHQNDSIKTIPELVRKQLSQKQKITQTKKEQSIMRNETKMQRKQPIKQKQQYIDENIKNEESTSVKVSEILQNIEQMADEYLMNKSLIEKDHKQFEEILKPYVLLKFTPEPKDQIGKQLFNNGLIMMAIVKLINRSTSTPFIFNYVYEYLSNTFRPRKNLFIFQKQAAKAKQNYEHYLDNQYLERYNNNRHKLEENQISVIKRSCEQISPISLKCQTVDSYQQTSDKKMKIGRNTININQKLKSYSLQKPEQKIQLKARNNKQIEFANRCPTLQKNQPLNNKGILKYSNLRQTKLDTPISPLIEDINQSKAYKNQSKRQITEQRQKDTSKLKNFDKINTIVKLSQRLDFNDENTSEKHRTIKQQNDDFYKDKKESNVIADKKRQPLTFTDLYEKYKKIKEKKSNSDSIDNKQEFPSKQKWMEVKNEEPEDQRPKSRKVKFEENPPMEKIDESSHQGFEESVKKKKKARSKSRSKSQIDESRESDSYMKENLRKKPFSKK